MTRITLKITMFEHAFGPVFCELGIDVPGPVFFEQAVRLKDPE